MNNKELAGLLRKSARELFVFGREDREAQAHELSDKLLVAADELEKAELVAWRCRDYADGWILYNVESDAKRYQARTGCALQPLYTHPPAPQVPNVTPRMIMSGMEEMARQLTPGDHKWFEILPPVFTAMLAAAPQPGES